MKTFAFYRIHKANFLLAFLLSFVGKVKTMKLTGIQSARFEILNDFKDHDHWHESEEKAYSLLKERFANHRAPFALTDLYFKHSSSVRIDYSTHIQQISAIELEQYIFFETLAKEYEKAILIPTLNHISLLKNLDINREFTSLTKINSFLDLLMDFKHKALTISKEVIKTLNTLTKSTLNHKDIDCISSGISPYTIPTQEEHLSFYWPSTNNVSHFKNTLYLLPVVPNKKQKEILDKKQVQYLYEREILRTLSKTKQLQFLISFVLKSIISFPKLLSSNFFLTQKVMLGLTNMKWQYFFENLRPKIYLTSLSTAWPSPPEALLRKNLDFKHIIWFYGTGEFHYSHKKGYKDLALRFSLFDADQVWVWNDLVTKLFKSRLLSNPKTEFITTGPLIYSVLKDINDSTSNAKSIAIFDIAPIAPNERVKIGVGPFTTNYIQEEFYRNLLFIIKKYPEIKFILKRKRKFEKKFSKILALEEIESLSNVELRDPFESPLNVLKDATFSISTPYTSPSILSVTLGKPAVYFDPTMSGPHVFDSALSSMTIYSNEDLIQQIESVVNGDGVSNFTMPFKKIPYTQTIEIVKEQFNRFIEKE